MNFSLSYVVDTLERELSNSTDKKILVLISKIRIIEKQARREKWNDIKIYMESNALDFADVNLFGNNFPLEKNCLTKLNKEWTLFLKFMYVKFYKIPQFEKDTD